jgi:uncharacterized OsmC-like protein
MVRLTTTYEGGLRCRALHGPSGATLVTDAPVDNHGKGEAFSPTDLLCASLASCALTIMGIAARTHSINIDGTQVRTTKIMGDNPRRVAEIILEFDLPKKDYTEKERKIVEHAANTCPVMLSLSPDVKKELRFNY